jgi:hypothetical protein
MASQLAAIDIVMTQSALAKKKLDIDATGDAF